MTCVLISRRLEKLALRSGAWFLSLLALATLSSAQSPAVTPPPVGHTNPAVLLETLSWDEAEHILTPDTIVVIALGAESKEHGRHLQLNNDFLMAEYLKKRVLDAALQNTVIAPTINYSFYPAFLEYPGSTSLSMETARAMITDIVHSLAHYGPRRFYILNTGISTLRPLAQATADLAKDSIVLHYTDLTKDDPVEKKLRQSGGTHADEIETSMMLLHRARICSHEESRPRSQSQSTGRPNSRSARQRHLLAHRSLGRSHSSHTREGPSHRRIPCCHDPKRHRGSSPNGYTSGQMILLPLGAALCSLRLCVILSCSCVAQSQFASNTAIRLCSRVTARSAPL